MKVGFIGLGIMGREMAQHIGNNGFELKVWNRSLEILKEFKGKGIEVASTIPELVKGSDVLISCVTNEQALNDIYFGNNGIIDTVNTENTLIPKYSIDCSTVAPSFIRELAQKLLEYDISFLDAPVTGGDVGAKNGALTTMVGGDEKVFQDLLPILNCFSKAVFYMGPNGSGQEAKCVNQIAIAAGIAAMTESLFFCEEKGLPVDKMLSILQSGSAGSWAMSNYAPRVLDGNLRPGFYARDMLKDIRIVLREAENSKTPLPVTALLKELYTALINKKGEGLGNHALIEIYREIVSR